MTFKWEIDVGNIIVAIGLLVGFFAAHIQNVKKLQDIETRLEMIFNWWTNHVVNKPPSKGE